MKAFLDVGIAGVILLMMVSVGMELEGRHFRTVARRKGALLLTLAAQAVILPALGFGLAHAMALPTNVAAGLLLVAACPVGGIASFYVLLARANLALSVTLNTVSILFSAATMSIAFAAYDRLPGTHLVFVVPTWTQMLRLVFMMAFPVAAGMAIRRTAPGWVDRCRNSLHRILLAGIVSLVATTMMMQRELLSAEWRRAAAAAALFGALALLLGLAFSVLLRLSKQDSCTVAIGFPARNVAMAMAIAVTLLDRIEYTVFAVVFFIIEVPLLLGAVAAFLKWWTSAPKGGEASASLS